MSDRISIDHISNTITIHIQSTDLSEMSNDDILSWVKLFIQDVQSSHLQKGIVGDISN